jgi:hypothetical protein
MLILLSEIDNGKLGDYRTINGPNICPSLQEIANAVKNSGMNGLGAISFDPDPEAAAIVASWPGGMKFERAAGLGLQADESVDVIIEEYISEQNNL